MKSLTSLFMDTYPKARPWLVVFFIIVISISPIIPGPESTGYPAYIAYKSGVNFILLMVILFLIFDIYKEFTKRDKELLSRLGNIDEHLRAFTPQDYEDFNDALPAIKSVIIERLAANKDIQLRILAVAAQFTWKNLVQDRMEQYLREGKQLSKLTIQIAICTMETLEDWSQEQLMVEEEKNLKGIKRFKSNWKGHTGEEGRINLEIFQYDTLPQWHGILIDDDVLFRGKCEWSRDFKELHVGQRQYIKFEKNDRFGGAERIALFENWFRACQERSNFLRDTGRLERNP